MLVTKKPIAAMVLIATTALMAGNAGPLYSRDVGAPDAGGTPPVRDPHSPGFVDAIELPDRAVPPVDADGNYILAPNHSTLENSSNSSHSIKGRVKKFVVKSEDSSYYPGIAKVPDVPGVADPDNPDRMIVKTSVPKSYRRKVTVYIPNYDFHGNPAPFIVGQDGPDKHLIAVVDRLITEGRLPPMMVVSLAHGGDGDQQGSERGLEYDTMSSHYADFVEDEILPQVEKRYGVRLSRDPEARATIGGSSGAACAFIMAWYRTDLYRRVISYSGTFTNQQWPWNPETPDGAWGFHARLIPQSPRKPIRVWLEVGDRDFLNINALRDGKHDWVDANERMANVLSQKGYHYQFVFARNAVHVDRAVREQTLPEALEWVWRGYRPNF